MAKYGDLINKNKTVVLCFIKNEDRTDAYELHSKFGIQIDVNTICIEKNKELCSNLRVKYPEIMVYDCGQLKYRTNELKEVIDFIEESGLYAIYG